MSDTTAETTTGGDRDRELTEQPSHDPAHQQERNEDGNQRDTDPDDGEADLAGSLERRLCRAHPVFDVPVDVLQHDNGVVDHEADRDREGHQREIVEAISDEVHDRACAHERRGTVTLGMMVAHTFRRKTKITITTSAMDNIRVNWTS